MAITTTYASGAIAAGDRFIKINAFTNPSTSAIGPQTLLRFAKGEVCLVTDVTNSPTLGVVRGYAGTPAQAHSQYEGVTYGLETEAWPAVFVVEPVATSRLVNSQEVTITGTTGTDAAIVTVPSPAILNCSGASGAGVNLPVPSVGMSYVIKNTSSGTMKVYCVGGSLNGTTGTTAVSLTTTGTLGDQFFCATSGAWQGAPTSV